MTKKCDKKDEKKKKKGLKLVWNVEGEPTPIAEFSKWAAMREFAEFDLHEFDMFKDIMSTGSHAATTYQHPLSQYGNAPQFSNPDFNQLKTYVQQSLANGGDPVTSLRNMAANAHISNGPEIQPSSRGSRPLNWSMTLMLHRLGFRDAASFQQWFTSGGDEQIRNMAQKMQSQSLS